MSDKVDYSKITVSFNDIVVKLHQVAIKNAEAAATGIQCINDIFSLDKDPKFLGSGQACFKMSPTDTSIELKESDISKYVDYARGYFKTFLGKEVDELITDKILKPFSEPVAQTPPNENNDETSEKPGETSPTGSTPSPVTERLFFNKLDRMTNTTLKILFEDVSPSSPQTDKEDLARKITAFGLFYEMTVFNQKPQSYDSRIKKLGKAGGGLVDAIFGNTTIKLDNGTVINKNTFKQLKVLNPVPKQTQEQIEQSIKSIIKRTKGFAESEPRIQILDNTTLLNNHIPDGKVEDGLKQKLNNNLDGYSLIIVLDPSGDNAFRTNLYNKKQVAQFYNEGRQNTGTFLQKVGIGIGGSITENDVFFIDNWKESYQYKSAYDKRQQQQPSSPGQSYDNVKPTKTQNTTKESLTFGFDDMVVEELMTKLFESSRMTYNILNQNVFEPYKKKYNSTKFIWKKELIDAKIKELYNKNDETTTEIKNRLLSEFQEMYKYQDIDELMNNPPLVNYKNINKDSPDANIMDGIAKCLEIMFENTTPPATKDDEINADDGTNVEDGTNADDSNGEKTGDKIYDKNDRVAYVIPNIARVAELKPLPTK